jgi:sec-independent protein translocase protein TatA
MFGLSLGHMLIIGVVVMLFGGRRLPELGSALGRGMNAFKKGLAGEEDLPVSLGHDEEGVKDPEVLPPSESKKS